MRAYLCLACAAVIACGFTSPAWAAKKTTDKPAADSATSTAASTSGSSSNDTANTPHKDLSKDGALLDRVVALVNDGLVLESELDEQTREITDRLRQQNVALPTNDVMRQQVLDRLVLEEIQAQRADRAGIKVSDEQVNAAMEDIAKRQGTTLEQLPATLAAEGLDYAQYRNELRREIARQILRSRDVVQRITITPRELDQYLEHEKKTASAANEYNVSHILIPVAQDASPSQMATVTKRAQEVEQRARAGEDFGKLAITYSASETALDGGSLGWRKGTELPTFLADVIARMHPGEVSDLIQTPSGFHIVRLNDTRTAGGAQIVQQVHLRHILLKTSEIEDDATVRQKLSHMRDQIISGKDDFAVLAKPTRRMPAPRSTAVTWGGCSPTPSCRSSQPRSNRSSRMRSASRSTPSSAGTLCRCSVVATSTTRPTRRASAPTRRCATAASKRPRSCGCSRSATNPTSSCVSDAH